MESLKIIAMKSYALCPVSDKKVNEIGARINAGFTVLLLLVFVFTQSIFPIVVLAIDFLLRSTVFSKYSLIGISSSSVVKYLSLNKTFINAGPKIFAARIGMLLSSLIILLFFINAPIPTFVIAGILGLFSFLESGFGYCVACEIYPIVYRLLYRLNFQN